MNERHGVIGGPLRRKITWGVLFCTYANFVSPLMDIMEERKCAKILSLCKRYDVLFKI